MQKDTGCLIWNTAALLIAYMAVAMPLPVISIFVTKDLGLSNSLGGFAVGIVFLATILTRGFSGRFADRKGGKTCMTYGLFICTAATLVCFAATRLTANPVQAFSLLIGGRLVLGLGQNMALVGMPRSNIAPLWPPRPGTVFSSVRESLSAPFAACGTQRMLCLHKRGLSGSSLSFTPVPLPC